MKCKGVIAPFPTDGEAHLLRQMGLFVSRAGSASAKLRGKFVGAPGNTGQADQAAALIRGLQQTEVRRQEEGLVHVQGRDQLPRQQVATGIAGDDQANSRLS